MRRTRKTFLTAAAATGAAIVARSDAAASDETAAAQAFARGMRRFDDTLSETELRDIEKGIGDLWKLGEKLHEGLSNGDQPSPAFEIGE
jgi:hypothetical protein